jgi:hypothetical protein
VRATNQILSVNMRAMIQFLSNPAYRTIWIIGGGILLILSALPMLYNRCYGFRIPKTLSDERIWYPANSYAAKGMILTGIITIVVAGVLRLTTIRLQAGLGSRFCFQSNTLGPACLSRDVRRFRMLSPQRNSN